MQKISRQFDNTSRSPCSSSEPRSIASLPALDAFPPEICDSLHIVPWLAKELIIRGMRPDPEPLNSVWDWHAKRTVMNTYPDAAEAPAIHGFKLQGRMRRILLEKSVVTSGKILNVDWQSIEAAPESTRREMPQISRALPLRYSSRASSASASNFPAAASASI